MLAHVPSFEQNPRGSPDFLSYPVPKACMHVLGTGVPRGLGVARSASSPKAAQALGCSLTPGLRISFGRVTWMARAFDTGFSYCCVGFVFGSRLCLGLGVGNPASPGWGLRCLRLGLGFGLHPTILGWGFGACVPVCTVRMYPAVPGWGVRCGCVCLG